MPTSMRRREFFGFLGGAALASPIAALAQVAGNRPIVAYLGAMTESATASLTTAFQHGLQDLGYVEGRNIDIVYRFADGSVERLPSIAEEVVRLKPAVILATSVICAIAAKNLTNTVPIVTPALADAIHLGLVATFARPGGNVTGITPYVDGLPAKQVELALKVVPRAMRLGILGNSNDPKGPPQRREMENASRALGLSVVAPDVTNADEFGHAIETLAREHVDVVVVLQTALTLSERKQIAQLLAEKRLPTIYGYREHVDDGGLISYGVDLRWCWRRAASFVQKILNGSAPGDLPVEFPTRLETVVNLKAAKAIGLTIPESLLLLADEVIE
jgi:ABC-type uncharacterized transport system substrate-binding protein